MKLIRKAIVKKMHRLAENFFSNKLYAMQNISLLGDKYKKTIEYNFLRLENNTAKNRNIKGDKEIILKCMGN